MNGSWSTIMLKIVVSTYPKMLRLLSVFKRDRFAPTQDSLLPVKLTAIRDLPYYFSFYSSYYLMVYFLVYC